MRSTRRNSDHSSGTLKAEKQICKRELSSRLDFDSGAVIPGPPGTGKTSLCKALAHKLAIRLSDRYRFGQVPAPLSILPSIFVELTIFTRFSSDGEEGLLLRAPCASFLN